MRAPTGRRSAAAAALLLAALVVASSGSAAVAAAAPPGLSRFMAAVGSVESGGDYYAVNPTSGAFGKYQIMPANWRAWAHRYLGNSKAKPTPRNQERVARAKIRDLHRWLRDWRVVAHWWLTGRAEHDPRTWSKLARNYIKRIFDRIAKGGKGGGGAGWVGRTFQERNVGTAYTGPWVRAGHRSYSGRWALQSTRRGARMSFTFAGTGITWLGPEGPTRGRAKVWLDGRYLGTIDAYATGFRPRAELFRRTWKSHGTHTLTIEIVGTTGRPVVSIDAFAVRGKQAAVVPPAPPAEPSASPAP